VQEESQQLLQRAELAEGQVRYLQDHNLSLSTKVADTQQQLPALQSQLQVRSLEVGPGPACSFTSSTILVHMNQSACLDQAGCRLTCHWVIWQQYLTH